MFKKKKSSGAKSDFNAQEFLIQHVEKIIFGIVGLLSLGLVYLGVTAKTYSSTKTPESLSSQATQVSGRLKENHWAAMVKEDAKRNVKPVFETATRESRNPVNASEYPIVLIPPGDSGTGKLRVDPKLAAPTKLEARYFYGPIATLKSTDPLEKLEDAKKPEERVRPPRNSGPGGMGGKGGEGGAPPGYPGGSGGPGGGYPGMGGPAGPAAGSGERRILSYGYDRGFAFGMKTFNDPNAAPPSEADAKKAKVAVPVGFVAVTALAPHEEMEKTYQEAFGDSDGFMEGRDHPIYKGFEVQRVEITDPSKAIAEGDWQPLPKAGADEFKEMAKSWVGSCSEVHLTDWTNENLSMPIPPVLLKDYKTIASHSSIPTSNVVAEEEKEDEIEGGSEGGFAGGGTGYGGMPSMAGGGPPSGYGGGGGGMPSGYGGGGPPSGYGGGGGGMPSGYGGGGPPSGYGGMGMSGGGSSVAPPIDAPKKLASTKYKLVRFYDFKAEPGKTYKYRVRLVMYDSNYPESVAMQPRASTLTKETLERVRALQNKEPKEPAVAPANATATPVKRNCRRETEWSEPSEAIAALKPTMVYASEVAVNYAPIGNGDYFENGTPKSESVLVDFQSNRALMVPVKGAVERGSVFALKKGGVEIIHPITKVLKVLKDPAPAGLVAVVDIRGSVPLKMGSASKDPIKTGGELVTFDAQTGQIVVSREFDDFTEFNMFAQPDQPAVGPLGGGLKISSGATAPGGGMMGPAGGGGRTGGPGAAGPGAAGPGAGTGGGAGSGAGTD